MVSCSAASFYPLSSRALESTVWSWRRFVCSECLAISWKTQQISALPPLLRAWDPQPGPGCHLPRAWRLRAAAGPQTPAAVNASAGTEGLGTALCFLGWRALLRAHFMAALELPTLQPLQAPGKPPPQPCQSPKVLLFPCCTLTCLPPSQRRNTSNPKVIYLAVGDLQSKVTFPSYCTLKACHSFLLQ